MKAAGLAAVVAVAWLLASATSAHDTWLLPRALLVARGAGVTLDLTSGMGFPELDHAIEAGRIEAAHVRLAGRVWEFSGRTREKHSLRLTQRLQGEGVAVAWVALAPKALRLTEDQVEEYLHEIGLAEAVGPAWRSRPQPRRWRETYRKLAKTAFRVGAAGDGSWAEPVGLPLEIVPEADPTALRAGDTLAVRVLREGRPLSGFVLAADPGRAAARRFATTDAEGRLSLVLDAAGPWMLAGTDLRPAGTEWESDFTTLTLEVGVR